MRLTDPVSGRRLALPREQRVMLEAEGDLSPTGRVYKRARRWALSKLLRGGEAGASGGSSDKG